MVEEPGEERNRRFRAKSGRHRAAAGEAWRCGRSRNVLNLAGSRRDLQVKLVKDVPYYLITNTVPHILSSIFN